MTAEEVIQETVKLCRSFQAQKVILYGSRAKHTERADEKQGLTIPLTFVILNYRY